MASNNTTRDLERFEEEVDRLADERGISFSAALALKNGEAPRPAKKNRTAGKRKAMTSADREEFRELEEVSIRNLEMACGQLFKQMLEDGTVTRHAEKHGLSYRDAFRELQTEVYQPLTEAQLKRSGRGMSSSPVETEAEEREQLGFTNKEVEWRAKSRGIPYRDAFNQLAQERAASDNEKAQERRELETQAELEQRLYGEEV